MKMPLSVRTLVPIGIDGKKSEEKTPNHSALKLCSHCSPNHYDFESTYCLLPKIDPPLN